MQEPHQNAPFATFKSAAVVAICAIAVFGLLGAFFGYRVGKKMAIRDHQKAPSNTVR